MAAPILSYEGLGLVQGGGWLFQDIDIYVGPRDRLALIGRNGAGKTTLLKLLAGQIDPDKGKRVIVPGTHVVMLEQEPDFSPFATLMDFAVAAPRSEEHTSELQSLMRTSYAVFCLQQTTTRTRNLKHSKAAE